MVTRDYVRNILRQARLAPADEARILELPYPIDRDHLLSVLASMGLTPDWMNSRLGGSP